MGDLCRLALSTDCRTAWLLSTVRAIDTLLETALPRVDRTGQRGLTRHTNQSGPNISRRAHPCREASAPTANLRKAC
jgi:hypothetical protein